MNATAATFDFMPAGPVTGTFTPANDPNLEWAFYTAWCPDCNPHIPNTQVATINNWLRSGPAVVPYSWPVMGDSAPQVASAWMGPAGISDFVTHYWATTYGRVTYPWGMSVPEATSSMRKRFYERQPFININTAQFLQGGMMGQEYTKAASGGSYNPLVDILVEPGASEEAITAQVMTGAAVGAAGMRLYSYQTASQTSANLNAAAGSLLQTGSNPVDTLLPHWRAMAYGTKLLNSTLTPFVLGVPLNSPAYGTNVITGARQGSNGRMLMIVNGNGYARTVNVSFAAYTYGYAPTRYRVSSTGIRTDVLNTTTGESITLSAGETVVYLFPNASTVTFTDAVPMTFPGGYKVALVFGYVYPDDLSIRPDVIDCSTGCTLAVDRRLGPAYYQMRYTDSNNQLLGTSPIKMLPTSGAVQETWVPQ
jgi:hypothetical protein